MGVWERSSTFVQATVLACLILAGTFLTLRYSHHLEHSLTDVEDTWFEEVFGCPPVQHDLCQEFVNRRIYELRSATDTTWDDMLALRKSGTFLSLASPDAIRLHAYERRHKRAQNELQWAVALAREKGFAIPVRSRRFSLQP